MAQPGRLERTRGDRVQPGRISEDEAEQESIFGRREDPFDRGADERAHHLGQMDERVGCGSEPRHLGGAKHDGEPAPMQRVGEVGGVGELEASAQLELIGAHGRRAIAVAVDPDGLPDRGSTATPRHPRDVDERVPADRARHRILSERSDHRDGARREAPEERGLPARLRDAAPADAADEDADDQQREGGEGAAATVGRRG